MDVKIRQWKESDCKDLSKILSNEKVLNNLRDGIPFPYTEKDALEYINSMILADQNSTFAFAIEADGALAGSIGAFRQANIHSRTAELGYYLGEDFWGQGIITKAISLVCEYIFKNTDILRIFAEPFSYNIGSRKALEKCGFEFEGILKNNVYKNGQVLDMAIYSLTRYESEYYVRRLCVDEFQDALDLSWEVFLEFEAPEYSEEGIKTFRDSLDDKSRTRNLIYYGAFFKENLIGVLCTREPQHIGGFFVKKEYQGMGFGRMLFEVMKKSFHKQEFTVNSSPYAVKIYEHLGFVKTAEEQLTDGVRYVPMVFDTPHD